jgi:hypothetical protein
MKDLTTADGVKLRVIATSEHDPLDFLGEPEPEPRTVSTGHLTDDDLSGVKEIARGRTHPDDLISPPQAREILSSLVEVEPCVYIGTYSVGKRPYEHPTTYELARDVARDFLKTHDPSASWFSVTDTRKDGSSQ